MNLSIRMRLALAMWGLVASVVIAVTVVADTFLRSSIEQARTQELQKEAERLESFIVDRQARLSEKVEHSLSTHPQVIGALDGVVTKEQLKDLRRAAEVDRLAVVPPTGEMVVTAGSGMSDADVPQDAIIRNALQLGIAGQDLVRRGDAFEMRGVHPIFGEGRVIGAVLASYVLDQAWPEARWKETQLELALTQEVSVLASTHDGFDRVDSRAIFAVKAQLDDPGPFIRWPIELHGEPHDAVFCPIDQGEEPVFLSTLVMLVSARPMLETRKEARSAMALTGSIGVGLSTLLAALFAYGLSRPIRRLADVADAMRHGDLARRTGIRRGDEIGELAQAFDEMAATLQGHVETVRRLAVTDDLTGLPNHRRFKEELEREVARHLRFDASMCLVFLDIDHFKRVNDTYGHSEGDLVLKDIARELQLGVRAVDTACRYGGEEFGVILPNTEIDAAIAVAERIRAAVAGQTMGREGQHVTLSAGVAMLPADGKSAQELLERADARLYQAKESGRNRVVHKDV
jgi:diguanylate cyclase (GGDEF)-like protein